MFYIPPLPRQVISDVTGIEYLEDLHPQPPGFKVVMLACGYCNSGDKLDMRVGQSEAKVKEWLKRHDKCKELAERHRTVFAPPLWRKP